MAVKSKEDILSIIREKFKDDTTDSTLSFIEDVSDTINDLGEKASGETEWKKKYEENDKQWREKYKNRFFEGTTVPPKTVTETATESEEKIPGYKEDGTPMSFEDLFKK